MQKKFALLALAATLAAPAFAEGMYLGGDLGRSKVEVSANGYSASKNATTWSAYGGYQFHPNFAAEAGYRDWGKIESTDGATTGTTKAHGLEASLVGSMPLSNEFSVFGRAGLTRIKATAELRQPGSYTKESESKTKAMFGIGARYALSKEAGLVAEYRQVAKIEGVKLSALTIGADYRF